MTDIARRVSGTYTAPAKALRSPLTPREEEVARLLVRGLTYGEIGRRLGCSPRTVKSHVQSIAAKLPPDELPAKARVQVWAYWRYVAS